MSDTVTVRLPEAATRTLSDWPDHPVVAELPRAVLVVGSEVHSPHGCALTPEEACAMGSAIAAAALCAGYSPQPTHDGELLVVASPIPTPPWGEPGWVYFTYGEGYVAARPLLESNDTNDLPQIIWGTGDAESAEHAWLDGLSLIAAGRYAVAAAEVAA